jgi:hypothetical protein
MDVAWKLGIGSKLDDWELRMSMRSFWTYYRGAGKYWIIGHIPSWVDVQQIKCLPWPDPYRKCKDANLLHKAIRLAMEPQISDPFIFCSDDQLLLYDTNPSEFKLWHGGEIPQEPDAAMNKWQLRLVNTGTRLRSAGYPAMNFEGHVPYRLQKEWIREALRFDFAVKPGMCVHSTIINCSGERGEPLDSYPVRAWLGMPHISADVVSKKLSRCRFASLNGDSLKNSHIVSTVEQLFPDPAPWELDGASWPRQSCQSFGFGNKVTCNDVAARPRC